MRFGASFRVAPGIYIHRSGNGGVVLALVLAACFALLWLYALVALAIFVAVSLLAYVALFVVGCIMTSNRLKDLQARAVLPSSVQSTGNYTAPRTWGVYKVETFKDGRRGSTFHLGNHPIRQQELEREFGATELILLFTSRTDAEELKYLLSNNLVSVSQPRNEA